MLSDGRGAAWLAEATGEAKLAFALCVCEGVKEYEGVCGCMGV